MTNLCIVLFALPLLSLCNARDKLEIMPCAYYSLEDKVHIRVLYTMNNFLNECNELRIENMKFIRGVSHYINKFNFFVLFFIRAISKLYICIPTNCTQLIYFIDNTLNICIV